MAACGDCLRKVKDVVRYRSKPVSGTAGAVAIGIIGLAGQAMTACRQGELAGVSALTAGDAHLQEVTHGIIRITATVQAVNIRCRLFYSFELFFLNRGNAIFTYLFKASSLNITGESSISLGGVS